MKIMNLSFPAAFAFALTILPACVGGGGGEECTSNDDCGEDICVDGACIECETDRDCGLGETCTDGTCGGGVEGEGEGVEGEGEEGEGEGVEGEGEEGEGEEGEGEEGEGEEGEGEEGEGEEGEGEEGEGEEGEGEEGEGEGGGCGDVSIQGECDGDVARFCVGEEVVEVDCSAEPFDADQTVCQEINPDYGFDCAVAQGESCVVGPAGEEVLALCQGIEAGCQLDSATTGTCVDDTGSCGVDTVGTCTGSVIVLACNALIDELQTNGQPLLLDCADVPGSTCTADVGCLNAPEEDCTPGLSACGTSADDAVNCPDDGVCPPAEGEGEGEGEEGEGEGGDPVPAGWFCPDDFFGDASCDCGCGAIDSDCGGDGGCIDPGCNEQPVCEFCYVDQDAAEAGDADFCVEP